MRHPPGCSLLIVFAFLVQRSSRPTQQAGSSVTQIASIVERAVKQEVPGQPEPESYVEWSVVQHRQSS